MVLLISTIYAATAKAKSDLDLERFKIERENRLEDIALQREDLKLKREIESRKIKIEERKMLNEEKKTRSDLLNTMILQGKSKIEIEEILSLL